MSSSLVLAAMSGELLKLAATRYEKEIAKGTVTRGDVTPGIPQLPGPLSAASRKQSRDALYAAEGLSGHGLDLKRAVGARAVETANAKSHGVPIIRVPAGNTSATSLDSKGNPLVSLGGKSPQMYRETIRTGGGTPVADQLRNSIAPNLALAELAGIKVPDALKVKPTVGTVQPQDPTLMHATLDHELGEVSELRKGQARYNASHLGAEPHIRERLRTAGDAAASNEMLALRQVHPEDAEMSRILRHVGATPDHPIPLGGKQQRVVEAMMDKSKPLHTVSNRSRSAQLMMHGFPKQVGMSDNLLNTIRNSTDGALLHNIEKNNLGGVAKNFVDRLKTSKYTLLGR